VSDGVAVHEIVRQQSQLERNSLNGVFDHEQFASGAKVLNYIFQGGSTPVLKTRMILFDTVY
jgi:hypothetical protein